MKYPYIYSFIYIIILFFLFSQIESQNIFKKGNKELFELYKYKYNRTKEIFFNVSEKMKNITLNIILKRKYKNLLNSNRFIQEKIAQLQTDFYNNIQDEKKLAEDLLILNNSLIQYDKDVNNLKYDIRDFDYIKGILICLLKLFVGTLVGSVFITFVIIIFFIICCDKQKKKKRKKMIYHEEESRGKIILDSEIDVFDKLTDKNIKALKGRKIANCSK